MKQLFSLIFLLHCHAFLFAQLFTKVTTGPVVSAAGDSRSVNFVDVNNDGWDDLFITNGPETGDNNFLYLNNGDGTFTAVAGDDIVSSVDPFDAATFGDCDNDGDPDAVAVTWWNQKNHFYRNNGDGTFTEETSIAMAAPSTYSEAASWGDYDLDGFIDLYISNSEGDFKNLLYHNNGDGSFTKVLAGAMTSDAFSSRGITWIDYDNDGDADMYVANESSQENNLYRNDGNGTFTKITDGPHVNDSRSSMSSSWGDIDNDGDFDLYVANSGNFSGQKNQLFINDGSGIFTEIITGDAVEDMGCSFSSSFSDYDNDGDLDLAVSNGFCNGTIENFLYMNDGTGLFTRDLTSMADMTTPCSYGCAWGDVNNDGFHDLVFATCNNTGSGSDPVDLFYMNNGNGNRWIKIKLEGTHSNGSAIGARVKLKATINGTPVWQVREVTAQSGYCSQNSMTIHFGLGSTTLADSLVVLFPGGNDTVLTNLSSNQELFIKEASTTGIEDLSNHAMLRCYPTISSEYLIAEVKNVIPGETIRLRLIGSSGKVAEEKEFIVHSSFQSITWKPLSPVEGMYILEATSNRWTAQCRIIFAGK